MSEKKKVRIIDFTKYEVQIRKLGFLFAMFFLITAFVLLVFAEFSITDLQKTTNIAYSALCFGFFNLIMTATVIDQMSSK